MLVLYYDSAVKFHYNLLDHNNDAYVSCRDCSVSMCRDFLKTWKLQYIKNKDKVVYIKKTHFLIMSLGFLCRGVVGSWRRQTSGAGRKFIHIICSYNMINHLCPPESVKMVCNMNLEKVNILDSFILKKCANNILISPEISPEPIPVFRTKWFAC